MTDRHVTGGRRHGQLGASIEEVLLRARDYLNAPDTPSGSVVSISLGLDHVGYLLARLEKGKSRA